MSKSELTSRLLGNTSTSKVESVLVDVEMGYCQPTGSSHDGGELHTSHGANIVEDEASFTNCPQSTPSLLSTIQPTPSSDGKALLFRCRARGVGPTHDSNHNAFVRVPQPAMHGQVLRCSNVVCSDSGRSFRWCSVCNTVAAKRNFWQRHAHGRSKSKSAKEELRNKQVFSSHYGVDNSLLSGVFARIHKAGQQAYAEDVSRAGIDEDTIPSMTTEFCRDMNTPSATHVHAAYHTISAPPEEAAPRPISNDDNNSVLEFEEGEDHDSWRDDLEIIFRV